MAYLIIKPTHGEIAYEKAVEAFRTMYEAVTGISLPVSENDDGISDLIVIGSDAVNDLSMNLFLDGTLNSFGIRYGTDDYCLRSLEKDGRTLLFLAGGRGRSTLYAVYDYFERVGNCHYFWDGDVISHAKSLPLSGLNVLESPRFEYRGLRYFAHRGLWRFQAEHWSLADWEREIDWMIKRRLNFFMLRIGMDDLWQRTFPESVPYPDPNETRPDSDFKTLCGYNDRSPFWSLEFRGILRQKLLKYATDRDLMHPEDCGTMSHWYSPAPHDYLDAAKPDFLSEESTTYNNAPTKVWDIRKQRNMDAYMALTDGYVREYNPKCNLFHTIGLAERAMSQDRDENLRLKLFTYHKIAQNLREHYPDSKLLLAGWDFFFSWTPEEVKKLISELDPERTLILDYTSESDDPAGCFLNWDYVGKFPWIFGLFHAYEAESSLRGPYDRTDSRLRVAVDDPNCKGMILWPELSHSDPLVLEYLTQNAWSPLTMKIEDIATRFCTRRYGKFAEPMNEAWQAALPIIKTVDWGGNTARKEDDPDWDRYILTWQVHREMWTYVPTVFNIMKNRHVVAHFTRRLNEYVLLNQNAASMLRTLASLPDEAWSDAFVARDGIDLARSIIGRFMNLLVMKAVVLKFHHHEEKVKSVREPFFRLYDCLTDILAKHGDYSLNTTLQKLKDTCPVNKNFEITLKRNIANSYCRQYAYELMRWLYPEELNYLFDILENTEISVPSKDDYKEKLEVPLASFMTKPLSEMKPTGKENLRAALETAAGCIATLDISVSDK